jgi:hypothetical protein
MTPHKMRYCGRDFSDKELQIMRRIIAEDPNRKRTPISRIVCKELGWHKIDGGLKEMSCRVAMLRMQEDGLLKLPPSRKKSLKRQSHIQSTHASDPQVQIDIAVNFLPNLQLELVNNKTQSALWNEHIHRYHYLGFTPLPGAQLRYIAYSDDKILALLGFGAAAWKVAPRDKFIAWDSLQRQSRLHLIANNSRFLILPWIKIKNLASKVLALTAKRLPEDWNNRYGYRPVLLETFVETNRFQGTCYKAANWIRVGRTQGRGKLDRYNEAKLPKKDIFLYPLNSSFKQILTD